MNNDTDDFSWVGNQETFVDHPNVKLLNHIVVGRYGGNSEAGQYKNEDGCLVWSNEKNDWEFVILLDAHNSSESAELILQQINFKKAQFKQILCNQSIQFTFKGLEETVLNLFQSEKFLAKCRGVTGETACLIVARKDKYVWWFSVGDCILFLHHKELATMGQYQLNQRQFYEWIGQVNTFEQDVPCYSIGTKELRQGENHLFLTTDGLIECPNNPLANPNDIFNTFSYLDEKEAIKSMLDKIRENNVRDSTTIVSWKLDILKSASRASNQ